MQFSFINETSSLDLEDYNFLLKMDKVFSAKPFENWEPRAVNKDTKSSSLYCLLCKYSKSLFFGAEYIKVFYTYFLLI